jgi:dTDP-4-dehydrorhamnose reductase
MGEAMSGLAGASPNWSVETMRIFITGNRGQLGRALQDALSLHTLSGGDLPELDVADYEATRRIIAGFGPDVVINAAAYTDTAGCERDPDGAYRANALGVQSVALACAASSAALVHISTNEVFDGRQSTPYRELDAANPLNCYARSKLAGEWYAQHLVQRFYVVRTAWLYGHGTSNFVHKITQLADRRGALAVVTDEVATPTSAIDLAQAIASLIRYPVYGIYHLTNGGQCSRFDWTRRILDLTGRAHVPLTPTTLASYGGASIKPAYSVLHNMCGAALGITLRPWEDALVDFLAQSPEASLHA